MSDDGHTVVVSILDKDYRFACRPEERDALLASAHYLDGKMREIRKGGRLLGADGLAVMAALNVTHELLDLKQRRDDVGETLGTRIRGIQDKIEAALSKGRQMEL
ncbi:MAG TPA: cell division protein ZapA [Gammaproteobacteria bacterium]